VLPPLRNLSLLVLAVCVVAATVWAVGARQRTTVERSMAQYTAVNAMLTAMLDQETGLRGYLQTGEERFLAPYTSGEAAFNRAIGDARRSGAAGDGAFHEGIDRAERIARRWHDASDHAIVASRLEGSTRVPLRDALARKAIMDRFRVVARSLQADVTAERRDAMARAQRLSAFLVIGLTLAFGAAGWLFIGRPMERQRRRQRDEAARREGQNAFTRTLQVMDSEHEAHDLVRRHLEQAVEGTSVVVLQRNNSADRLEPTTPVAEGTPLAAALDGAEPRSCLAIRLGRPHAEPGGSDLLECELCGKGAADLALCTPLLVSGEVIGSVLVGHDAPLGPDAAQTVEDTVTQAAPVLANMRNLAIAEQRAATDALTGLPNRRAVQDTVRRMIAQAHRSGSPLAAVAIDVDHFKAINDRFGHDRGDDVLAAVAQALAGTLRGSDFVGRQGGEEFLALLPDTDLSGALTAAENLRRAVEALEPDGLDGPVTASFGVAVHPEDGADHGTLLRTADRALYAAKDRGRNRVEAATALDGAPAALRLAQAPR
jgi:diguanylate cyclase (GGDEF)-like protein